MKNETKYEGGGSTKKFGMGRDEDFSREGGEDFNRRTIDNCFVRIEKGGASREMTDEKCGQRVVMVA